LRGRRWEVSGFFPEAASYNPALFENMDTVTHGIVGALIGKAFFADDPPAGASWRKPPAGEARAAILCATVGAVFPDIDVFETLFTHDNMAFVTLHRGVTHSLPMLLVWAAGLAALAGWLARRVRWPAPDFPALFSIFAAAIASHIFLDLLTSWGTMVWSPIDHSRLAWDWLFIIDLTLTLSALLPQLAAWAHRPKRPIWVAFAIWAVLSGAAFALAPLVRSLDVPLSIEATTGASILIAVFLLVPLRHRGHSTFGRVIWCRIGVVLVAGYISFAGGMHYFALKAVNQFATEGHIEYDNLAALPLPPWPARWSGLISTPNIVYRIQFNLLGGELPTIEVYRDAAPNRYLSAARELPGVQKFLWFARFPVFTYLQRDGHPVVQISDIRFVGPRRPGVGVPSTAPGAGFTYEVVFNEDGGVISSGPTRFN
jgi:membrane-bound metal-dependent hydrolase YbcI (DUF457 family)